MEPTLYRQDNLEKTKNITEWSGAFGIYKLSKTAIMKNLKTILSLAVIEGLATILYVIIEVGAKNNSGVRDLIQLIFILINSLISGTLILAMIKGVDNKTINVTEAYSTVFSKAADVVIVSILYSLISLISLFLLIIPAFFIIPRVYLSVYFVLDTDMGPLDAIKASWESTRGHVSKIYGILGVNILILLLSITVIGIIATVYFGFMYYAASAVFYRYITRVNTSDPKKV